MAGTKKSKHKKSAAETPTPVINDSDADLVDDLLEQLDSRDHVVQAESASIINSMHLDERAQIMESSHKQDAKSRFKARQARKAAALAQTHVDDPEADLRLAREAKEEEEAIRKVCKEMRLEVVETNPDGHCLFSAVADQVALLGLMHPSTANFVNLRAIAADYIRSHPDDFLPFLPSSGGEDTIEAHEAGLVSHAQFESYCKSVRETAAWGGEPEIVALSRAYRVPIHVVQGGKPPIVVHHPTGGESKPGEPAVWISYHRKLYGLGEHYNSLRPLRTTRFMGHEI